jgi:protein-disulfide isomerase
MLHPPPNAADHVTGPADAPVTLWEYGDFQCPCCYRAHPVVLRLQRQFAPRLRFIFRNFPLSKLHPHAAHAAEAAESVSAHAGEAAYWRMHHAIFEHQQDSPDALDDDHLVRYAADAGANPSDVRADLASGLFQPRVRFDFVSGARSGVNDTPTFCINGVRFEGDWSHVSELADAIAERYRRGPSRQQMLALDGLIP